MKRLIIIILIASFSIVASAKELAITIDDLTLVHQSKHPPAEEIEIFHKIVKILHDHNVSAVGFVTGNKIKAPYNCELLDYLVKNGHSVGNHTYSHMDLNLVPIENYLEDIAWGEKIIQKWLQIKYFRYPCLHEGDTPEKQTAVKNYLIKNGYTLVPVTIDNDDFLFDVKIEAAQKEGNPKAMELIGREYLEHMQERTGYFEKMARQKVGREVKHILLIHLNYLNSLYLDRLLTWYEQQGWKFITVSEALTDDVYKMENRYTGKKGLSWLERIENVNQGM